MSSEPCKICGDVPTYSRRRCRTCYGYLHRTGRDRSEDLIVRRGRRMLEDQLSRSLHGQAVCGDIVVLDEEAFCECDLAPSHIPRQHHGWIGTWTWEGPEKADLNLRLSMGSVEGD